MLDIVSVGNITVDINLKDFGIFIERRTRKFITGEGVCFPLGSKIRAKRMHIGFGGGGFNCALSFSKLGLRTGLIGRVGEDKFKEILEICGKNKITSFIQEDSKNLTSRSIIILPDKERTILSYVGAGQNLRAKEIHFSRLNTKWFFLSNLFEREELILKFFDFAKKNNIKIAANPSKEDLRFLKNNLCLLDNYSIFILNQEEASYLTGISYYKEKEIFKRLDDLVKGIVVMTKGKKGAILSDGKMLYKVPILKERRFEDKTGTGDAFAAGFVSGYILKEDIEYSLKLAAANACSVVEKIGAQRGFLSLSEFRRRKWPGWEIKRVKL